MNDGSKSFIRKQYSEISAIECISDPLAPYIILLHGYGGNASNFTFFPQYAGFNFQVNWVFPEAFIPLDFEGIFGGKAWFPISIASLQNDIASDNMEGVQDSFVMDYSIAINKLVSLINELNVDPRMIVIGGFSQGAILATFLALNSSFSFAGLLILAGILINPSLLERGAKSKSQTLKFLQTHGTSDEILPWKLGRNLYDFLLDSGLKGEMISFSGGHEIPSKFFQKFSSFMRELFFCN